MKNFKKRLFSMVVAIVLVFGMMGGAAMTVSAEELKETVETTTSSATVYTEQTDITYDEEETYTTNIMLSTSLSVASFQFSVDVPYFVEVKDVSAPDDLYFGETDYFTWSKTDSGFNVMFTSAEDRGGNFAIANVEYAVTENNVSDSFSVGSNIEAIFTNTQNETVAATFRFGNINVTSGEEEVTVLKGDANLDGVINLNDLIFIQQSIVENLLGKFNENQVYAADINGDGSINVYDCQYVQMYLVGELTSLENIGGGSTEESEIYNLYLNVCDQNGKILFQSEVPAEKGATYQDAFASVFKKLDTIYNITGYLDIQSDCYDNVSVDEMARLIVESSDIVYVTVSVGSGEEVSNNLYVNFLYKNGDEYVQVDSGSAYISADESLYAFIKDGVNNDFGGVAEIDGVYYDEEFKNPVTESDVVNETTTVYVVLVDADITGKTYTLLEAEYTSDGMQQVTEVGTVTFAEAEATVTYGDEKFVAPYGNMLGQVSIYKNDYAVMCLTLEGSDACIELNYDGSNKVVTEEFTAVAGEYPVSITGAPVQMTLTLYNNGVWKIGYSGVTMMGDYEISENGVVLYMYGYPQEFVYDEETNSFAPNSTSGGESDENVSTGISYDVSKTYGEYYAYDDNGNTTTTLNLSESGFVITENGEAVKGTEMYALISGNMAQVSLFVNDNVCYTYMVDFDLKELMLVGKVDATNAEETAEFKALAGTYRFIVDGMDMGITYELRSNGTIIGVKGGFVSLATYSIVSENVIEVTGEQVTVDMESMAIIMNTSSSDSTGGNVSDGYVTAGIAYGTYTYTDESGVEYWVDIYEDGSFYIKATDGTQASGNEVYAFSSEDLSLFVSDYECYHISIKSGSKELSYFGHIDYSDREVTQEYAKYAGTYSVSVEGMEATFILHDNGVVVGYLYGAKDITVYVINDNGTITIDGMGSATIDVENKIITPIMSDEVVEGEKVVVDSTVTIA